jgi:DNA-binding transcriptional LysR family regulator
VALTVVDDHLQRLILRVDAGELDLALIYDHPALTEIATRDLHRAPLFDDVYRLVLPAGHRLARARRPLELSDLRDEPWIGGAPTSAWYRIVVHACRLAGFVPEVSFASDNHIAVQALVAAGLGVSLIPGLALLHPLPGLEVRTLASGAPVREISAARPRDGYDGPSVMAMLDCLRIAALAVAPATAGAEATR